MPVRTIPTETSPEASYRTTVIMDDGPGYFDTGAATAFSRFHEALAKEGIDPGSIWKYTAVADVVTQGGVIDDDGQEINLWQRRKIAVRWKFVFTIPTKGSRVVFDPHPAPGDDKWEVRT